MDFGAAWRTGPVLSLGRFDVADNRIHDAPHRQQLLALRSVQVLDCLSRQERPHEPVQAREAEHHFVVCALGAEGVSFDGFGLGHTVIPFLLLDTRRNRARIGHPDGNSPCSSNGARWVVVSLSFVAADIVLIKALGLGTAIAVFLDATIVRALLVPVTMRLLGEWNWWAPKWRNHNP